MMKIKLFPNAASEYVRRCYRHAPASCGRLHSPEFAAMLEKVNGQWLEIETDYLFADQFNTAPIEGVSELGLRVMAESVEQIEGDIRPGKIFDRYTHKHYTNLESVPPECLTNERKKYLSHWETFPSGRGIYMQEVSIF